MEEIPDETINHIVLLEILEMTDDLEIGTNLQL